MNARIGFIHFGTYPDIRVVKMTDTLAKAGYEVIVLARNIKGVTEPGAAHPYAHLIGQQGEEWRSRLRVAHLLPSTADVLWDLQYEVLVPLAKEMENTVRWCEVTILGS